MAVKLCHKSFLCSRSSKPWRSGNQCEVSQISSDFNYLRTKYSICLRISCVARYALTSNDNLGFVGCGKQCVTFFKIRKRGCAVPFVSPDDGVTVNGNVNTSTTSAGHVENMRVKLSKTLQDEDFNDGLVQSLHDMARVFELAIKERSSFKTVSWFSTVWLGVDRNAWVKELAYQTAVFSLLQAASEIASRGDSRDREVNVFVHKSLIRLATPMESLIRDKLSSKQPEAYQWFWSEQIPSAVTSFIKSFESDPRFPAATTFSRRCIAPTSGNACDVSFLMLALTCIATTTKLGPAKVLCSQFFSMVPEITGRLMDMLVDLIPVSQAYDSIKDIGLRREFLVHFGPRAASCIDQDSEEVIFWVDLVQKQLQHAIDREKIWSRLTTSESIEVLEKDLAIFGFFIALGRSTQSFLLANGFDIADDSLADFIRYLIGGSVLYYPQLSSISSYQLYVEVVCEELEWFPFYPDNMGSLKQFHMHNSKQGGPPNAEAVPQALDVCSHWMCSFIKYSTWLQNPSNVKAAEFLSRGHKKLMECMQELRIRKDDNSKKTVSSSEPKVLPSTPKESDSFDKALESVEEAMIRLESLLQELHVSSTSSGKEHLKAACTDLEKIRKLKKEAEFLEASFRAKAASLQQEEDDSKFNIDVGGHEQNRKGGKKSITNKRNRSEIIVVGFSFLHGCSQITRPFLNYLYCWFLLLNRRLYKFSFNRADKFCRFWSFFSHSATRNPEPELDVEPTEDYCIQQSADGGESSEIKRFELLRCELMELEKRVERSAYESDSEQDIGGMDRNAYYSNHTGDAQLVQAQKKMNIIEKSFTKLKETGTDVYQGTQLLAIDVAAAMGLVRRQLIGDELSKKEKKALKRTATDVASVVPIGILMLLPVTAVGHAAMLAAIQRYVPALIPSTYAPDRLDLLRQLEKVKQMTNSEIDENEEEVA